MKMSQRSRGGGYEQGESATAGAAGRRNASLQRFSVAARRRPRNTFARIGRGRRDTVQPPRSVSERVPAHLKAREADVENEETQRLRALVANLSMSSELLREKIHRMEAGRPLVWRRPKP